MGAQPQGAVVRVARPQDVEAAGALTAEAYLADRLLADDGYETELRDARRRADEAVLLVATVPAGEREAVVGTVTLAPYGSSYAEIAHPGEWELRMLAVAPEARRQGLANQLVLSSLREAVAAGARRVVLSTLDSMHAAHRLYERLGFVPAPDRDWTHEDVRLAVHTWTPPEPPGALVEAATWRPLRMVEIDGWQVGLSGGLTRRANSALALADPADLDAAVERVELLYDGDGLPPTFRVESAQLRLRATLLDRGYREVSVTDVLVRPVGASSPAGSSRPPVAPVDIVARDEPSQVWLTAWCTAKGAEREQARALLTGSAAQYLTAMRDGRAVGVARVAYAEGWAGLSSLAVVPDARRGGIARALTATAHELAGRVGARDMFLQVEVPNQVAWQLYAREGFRPAARYSYLTRTGS
ncbi:MAG: GNAT family N-acetyltransferase [Actinobacteria bacterium]|nr:GNAT family N-acetyltransferase [Actinomycetota bacterium]